MPCIDWSITQPTDFTLHRTCSLVIFIALSCVLYTLVMLIFTKVAWKLIYVLHELTINVLWDNFIIMIPYTCMMHTMHNTWFKKSVWSTWQQKNASCRTKAEIHLLPQQKLWTMYNMCWWYVFFLNSIKYLQALPHGSISGERDTFSSRSMTVVADSSSACLWARVAAWSSIRRTMSWSTMAPVQRTHKRPLWGNIWSWTLFCSL